MVSMILVIFDGHFGEYDDCDDCSDFDGFNNLEQSLFEEFDNLFDFDLKIIKIWNLTPSIEL